MRAERGIAYFEHDYKIDVPSSSSIDLELFVDNGVVELGVSGGLLWLTDLFFPANPAGRLDLTIAAPAP